MTNSISEIEETPAIFIIGSNTSEAHPVIGYRVKKAVKNGSKLIVADPRHIEMVEYAHVWLRHRSGTDVALLNGILNIIIKEGLHDEDYINTRTENFSAVKNIVKSYSPDKVSQITGVSQEDLYEAARIYASAESAAILYAMGITQHTSGTNNVLALANLAMATGNVGKERAGVNPLRGQNNVQGACDMGALPNVYPGYQGVNSPEVKAKFTQAWGQIPANDKGLTITEIMSSIPEKIKGLYIMGENPVLSDPDSNHIKDALANLDFLVVQDIFLSETAMLADVVLPAAAFAEKEGTFTNTERRVQKIEKAVTPPGESKADWQIIIQLASKFGAEWNYLSPAEILEEISTITPSYGGINNSRLNENGLQWPCLDNNHGGTKFLHQDKFARGLGKFCPVEYSPPQEKIDADYPYLLTTGRKLNHFHTGTMTRRSFGLNIIHPEELVELNPEDAKKLQVDEGQEVIISSRRGKVKARVEVTEQVPPGLLFMSFHFHESAANLLTNPAFDPVAKIPELKVCAVKVEKA